MAKVDWKALFADATLARERAYAPYSSFKVGAAVLCADGSVVTGCNVENVTFGLTVCAERNAFGRMVLEGKTPVAVAIVTGAQSPTPPCGMCRQVMAEFAAGETPVRSQTLTGLETKFVLQDLLPHGFTRNALERAQKAKKRGK